VPSSEEGTEGGWSIVVKFKKHIKFRKLTMQKILVVPETIAVSQADLPIDE